MSFKSVNEIEQFRFDDCQICCFAATDQAAELNVEALIVGVRNSQNKNLTESYAGETQILMRPGKIERIVKDGFRYYNADNVLVSEVPDEELGAEEAAAFPQKCAGAYLYEMKQTPTGYMLAIEFEDEEEHAMGNSYRVYVCCETVEVIWERYMNRVQK